MLDLFVGIVIIRRRNHRVHQIDRVFQIVQRDLAGLHRAARDENHRNVQAHCRHQHTGGDLVAVRNTDHRVGAMGVDHVFHTVGDHFARRQRIKHPVMAHRDAVIHGDGVEFLGDTPCRFDFTRNHLPEVFQMHMAGYELGKTVDHGDDRFAEIAVGHSGGAPKSSGTGHVPAMGRSARAVIGHCVCPLKVCGTKAGLAGDTANHPCRTMGYGSLIDAAPCLWLCRGNAIWEIRMSKLIYILNGPNLNLLGKRQPELYGHETLEDVEANCRAILPEGYDLRMLQSNYEGQLVDWIQQARTEACGIVINPAAYTHTSIAILDALYMFEGPVVEVHISNILEREEFRHFSYVEQRADKSLIGLGVAGYQLGVQHVLSMLQA